MSRAHFFILLQSKIEKMLSFISFGSGSCGNCYYIFSGDYGILIDAGIGIRKLKKYFSDYGLSLANVRCILVTHDHADHVKAVGLVSNTYGLPVYATERVHEGIYRNYCVRKKVDPANIRKLSVDEKLCLGDFVITPFHVPHDSLENVGFKIVCGGHTFCLMTDVGHLTDGMAHIIGEAEYLVIEANYDEEMLWSGVYPDYLKKRVSGGNGHLSNKLCAKAIIDNATERLRHIWLCHLSQENNHPELARKTVELELKGAGLDYLDSVEIDVLRRNVPSKIYEIK